VQYIKFTTPRLHISVVAAGYNVFVPVEFAEYNLAVVWEK
jgi:hypothetical protein